MESNKLIIINKTEELEKVQAFIDELSSRWLLKPEQVFELNLILEEYITNLINYGYHDAEEHQIIIEFSKDNKRIKMMIFDDAGPFDLTKTPENQEINKPIEERRIGGLGIHFIKKLADELHYQTNEGENRLIIVLKLK
jgi:anti-sigma regulatory factor (Ser/Thr protein kinase)